MISNHLTHIKLADVLSDADSQQVHGRAVIVKKVKPLPIEAIVRGYLAGSGWKDYQKNGTLCGITLPSGLQLAEKLPTPIYTPSTKADLGYHDENIDFIKTCELIGPDLAMQVREISLDIYQKAHLYAAGRGIIIADTKFEFGLDAEGQLILIDEVLTSDSSRFGQWNLTKLALALKVLTNNLYAII
ncbi:phosphoribosylaminoimidazole-succinocarboxamide synthase [Beggiatoa sp. PS]|nr:phosphoribosylaminoimidazole-succinocarboxamide synthase [Beggiatoa sp. PS]